MSEPTPSRRLRGTEILDDPLVRELVEARLVCVLATGEADGGIHAVPMWFAKDDDALVLATASRSRKVANVGRDARATFVIHDSRPGFEVCGASIRGRVDLLRGAAARSLVELVHRRYVGAGAEAIAAVAAFLNSDDAALRLHPDVAFTWDERPSDAARALRKSAAALPLLPTEPRTSTHYFGSGSSL